MESGLTDVPQPTDSSTILAMGEPLIELNAATGHSLRTSPSYTAAFGGDTSNAAVAAARQGASVSFVTRVGDDAFGDAFLDLWRVEGVDSRHVVREPGGRTGVYFISRDPQHSSFTYYRNQSPASRLSPADVPVEEVRSARVLHTSGITQAISESSCEAAFHAMTVAREAGTLVSYDPNHRPALWDDRRARTVVGRSLEVSDIALPNLDEGRWLSGEREPHDVLAWLVGRGPGVVVLKLGEDGALVACDGDVIEIPPHPVTPVDSTGAGDTFDGAFLARLLLGDDPPTAARYAAVAAALATQGHGAVSSIPHACDVQAVPAPALRDVTPPVEPTRTKETR
jgi:2-dehydro-3-deoxygluconokinase